jgi:hypothetical protein
MNNMKNFTIIISMVILTLVIGIWLDKTLPHYGYALGTGLGLAFLSGTFWKWQ